jgi:hypothetical protein
VRPNGPVQAEQQMPHLVPDDEPNDRRRLELGPQRSRQFQASTRLSTSASAWFASLLSLAAMLIVAVLAPEQMHQGASQQQQIWSDGEYVASVIPKQVHAERSNAEQHKQANLRPYEATECRHNRLLKQGMAARSRA